jgi:hypothetical protein
VPAPPTPIFFVHVMKTGGTTLFRHLRQNFELDELYPYRHLDIRFEGPKLDIRLHLSLPYLQSLTPERRQRIRVYTGHFPFVACELLGGPFVTMTILRDPVDRTVSLLRQFRRRAPWRQESLGNPGWAARTLEELYEHELIYEPLVHNHQAKIFSMTVADHPDSYMDPITVDRARLELAKENLARVDVLGLTERYDELLDDVQDRFGWVVQREARANPTPSDDQEPVSEALLRRIAEDNALDLELYEHAQRLQAERRSRRLAGA